MVLLPPALFKKGEEGRKKKEVLHLSRCYTHTQACVYINILSFPISSHLISSRLSVYLLPLISLLWICFVRLPQMSKTHGKTLKQLIGSSDPSDPSMEAFRGLRHRLHGHRGHLPIAGINSSSATWIRISWGISWDSLMMLYGIYIVTIRIYIYIYIYICMYKRYRG